MPFTQCRPCHTQFTSHTYIYFHYKWTTAVFATLLERKKAKDQAILTPLLLLQHLDSNEAPPLALQPWLDTERVVRAYNLLASRCNRNPCVLVSSLCSVFDAHPVFCWEPIRPRNGGLLDGKKGDLHVYIRNEID